MGHAADGEHIRRRLPGCVYDPIDLAPRVAVGLVLALALVGCGREHRLLGPLHPPPPLGARVLVLAPHPDDEVLGAAGLIERARRDGAEVTVVVATGGEAGSDDTHGGGDLALRRQSETQHALSRLGIPPEAVHFLGYADQGLGSAWGNRWTAARADGTTPSADAIVDDLRTVLRVAAPTTIALPMALDEHGDHRALNRFALLAVLAEHERLPMPNLLAYLIHGGRGWPDHPPLEPCVGRMFPWSELVLDHADVQEKLALIHEYRTQVGWRGKLLHYARAEETFALGNVISAHRSMGSMHPGVERTAAGIEVDMPRGECGADVGAGDRLRLRFVGARGIEERLLDLRSTPAVSGDVMGQMPAPASDVRYRTTQRAVRLLLSADLPERGGAVLELVRGSPERPAPAWLVLW
jgi:LmbE family N-acetylglucosaminyl deacetylase